MFRDRFHATPQPVALERDSTTRSGVHAKLHLLRVVVADLSSYEAFLKNKLTRLDGIASIESSFALSQVKYSIALPV